MLKCCSLYSGSSGNSFLIQNDKTNILIDVGVSCKKIIEALASFNLSMEDINAILITHEHIDHTKSLRIISKKYNIPIYSNQKTWNALNLSTSNNVIFNVLETFDIGNLGIVPFSTPHDAVDPCGFNIYYGDEKISIATDLGEVDETVFGHLKNSSFVMLESNYDSEILKYSHYPPSLKARIRSKNGHLDNKAAGQTICKLIDYGLKEALLIHLSKENNFPELAEQTVLEELVANNCESNINLHIAPRNMPSDVFIVS